jgi:hypothetical protein
MPFALDQNPDGAGQQAGAAPATPGTTDPATIGTGGQQPAPAATGNQPGSTAQPVKAGDGPLTLDTIRQVIREETPEIVRVQTEKAFQGVQKMTAKMEERVKADFKQQIAELNKVGIAPTEEQQRALLDQTRGRVLAEADGAGTTGGQSPVTQQPAAQEKPVNPVVGIAMKIIKNAGIDTLVENDPEYSMINQTTDDEKEFLDSVQKAADTKAARLQTQGNTRARNPSVAAGTGKSSGSGIANVTNPDDLYKIALGKT